MKLSYVLSALLSLGSSVSLPAQAPWQQVTQPDYSYMLNGFTVPPAPYGQTVTWGLEGPLNRESIARDLDAMYKQGLRCVSMEGGYGMTAPYLSAGYFDNVKIIVEELQKRGMHLWIIDEGKYPSGFAGGLISQKSPEMRMQGLVVLDRIRVASQQALHMAVPDGSLSAVAVKEGAGENRMIDISSGNLTWPAAAGNWEIIVAGHRFKTSATRSANNPTHGKDTVNSLIDYLNPAATRKFMEYTHEQYEKYVGEAFGKTILGFRGDEPEYGFMPWTPRLTEIFQEKKGYDIRKYMASFFVEKPTREQIKAKADYSDVWSDLFRDNFFKVQADWCKARGMDYIVHLDHEDMLMNLARSEGDFFKDMRYVQIPGVDAIWHQLWYDNVLDFPKLASSAAHLNGRPRAFSESFAAYRPAPTVPDARWVVNEQLVRGINLFEFMFWPSSARGHMPGHSYLTDTAFAGLSAYANRASWLLANGVPTAKVALYCATETMWLGNKMADSSLRVVGRALLEHQVDFDYIDRQAIAQDCRVQDGALVNLSGQRYSVVIIPVADMLPVDMVKRLQAFVAGGGKVYCLGGAAAEQTGSNFLDSKGSKPITGAVTGSWNQLSESFFQQLPRDVQFNKAAPVVKYLHRQWKNADCYFFFNEGGDTQQLDITVAGTGKAVLWNADTGTTQAIAADKKPGGRLTVPLGFQAYESRFLVIQHEQL